MTMAAEPLTRAQLAAAFGEVGLEAGDSVIIHSSFRSLGAVDGGPGAVVDALLDVIGATGNLMLPTFNYTRPLPEPYYDPATTPCRTGIIPELGRRRPEAVRSLHPTHSVAVIGPNAEALTGDHLAGRAFGIGSPIDRLVQRGGKVLLIGVGMVSNSTVHVAEERASLPKASWHDPLPELNVLLPGGTVVRHQLDTSPSCSAGFEAASFPLRRRGLVRDLRVGGCKLQLMRGLDAVERVAEAIADRPDILFCTWAGCKPCTGARRLLREQGRL